MRESKDDLLGRAAAGAPEGDGRAADVAVAVSAPTPAPAGKTPPLLPAASPLLAHEGIAFPELPTVWPLRIGRGVPLAPGASREAVERPETRGHRRLAHDARVRGFFRIFAALACALLFGYFLMALIAHDEPVSTVVVCVLLCFFLTAFVYLMTNPDPLRSQYTERSLAIASELLADIREGLNEESAKLVCERLLPETRAMTVSVTDTDRVLACAGELVEDFPAGSSIRTPGTLYAIEHGIAQSFTHSRYVSEVTGEAREVPAGIVAPLRVRDKCVGSLKFYFRRPADVDRTQYALVSGYAELISTQLAIHELERQDELTARAEVRALQAQINPHFLFNTLNTIAALTRTEPMRARELLREFAAFYRSTLDNSGSLIPLSREVAQTQRYLLFEKARFGEDRIVDSVDIQPAAADSLVPAFTIQPLVENAVRHAMRDEGPLHIRVTARVRADESLDLEVADDGVGMDEETASRLFTPRPPRVGSRRPTDGAGMAMRNIHERIERFYGPSSGVQVESTPDKGTRIVLHLDLRGSIFS